MDVPNTVGMVKHISSFSTKKEEEVNCCFLFHIDVMISMDRIDHNCKLWDYDDLSSAENTQFCMLVWKLIHSTRSSQLIDYVCKSFVSRCDQPCVLFRICPPIVCRLVVVADVVDVDDIDVPMITIKDDCLSDRNNFISNAFMINSID